MLVVSQHVPPALRGIVIAGFMAAFMSTIATQLNWGASYLVSDFYRRFIKRDADDKHYVLISRLATVLLVIASAWGFGAAVGHPFGMASRAGSRRGHRRRLPAALVLVADQCLERNFGHGDGAGRDHRAALDRAFFRQQSGGLCQDGFDHHRRYHRGLADCHLC